MLVEWKDLKWKIAEKFMFWWDLKGKNQTGLGFLDEMIKN